MIPRSVEIVSLLVMNYLYWPTLYYFCFMIGSSLPTGQIRLLFSCQLAFSSVEGDECLSWWDEANNCKDNDSWHCPDWKKTRLGLMRTTKPYFPCWWYSAKPCMKMELYIKSKVYFKINVFTVWNQKMYWLTPMVTVCSLTLDCLKSRTKNSNKIKD